MSVSPTRFINRWFCWAAAVSFVLAIPPAGLAAEAIHWQPDLETAKRLAAQQNKLVLVHIWAPWCAPCRKMEEEVFNNAALGRQLEAQYVAVKINTDDHPEAKQMFGIAAWPSDIILTPDGRVVEKLKGYRNSSQYGAVMAQLAAPYQTAATQVADARNPYGAARYQPQANPSAQQPTANTGNWDTQAGRYNPYGTSTPVAQAPVANQNPAPQTPADRTAPPNATAEMKLRVDNPATPPVVQPAVASQNAVAPAAQLRVAETKPAGLPPLGLEGFCPVTLVSQKKWVPGNPEWGVIHRGRLYLFTGADEKAKFFNDPDRYAPIASGHDPVLALDTGRHVDGRREFGVFFDGRIYLFAAQESRTQFESNPDRYTAEVIQTRLYQQ